MMYAYLSNFNQIIVYGIKDSKIRINKNTKLKIFQPHINHFINSINLKGNEICVTLKHNIDIKQECFI